MRYLRPSSSFDILVNGFHSSRERSNGMNIQNDMDLFDRLELPRYYVWKNVTAFVRAQKEFHDSHRGHVEMILTCSHFPPPHDLTWTCKARYTTDNHRQRLEVLTLNLMDIPDQAGAIRLLSFLLKNANSSIPLELVPFYNSEEMGTLHGGLLRRLATALHGNHAVSQLELNHVTCSSSEGWEAIAECLPHCYALRTLRLHNSTLRDVQGISTALAGRRSTIRSLDLSCIGMGDEGAVELATRGLRGNATLWSLELENNAIGDEGLVAIARVLSTNKSLKRLHLGNNFARGTAENGMIEMGRALRNNKTLLSLDLSYNCIGDHGMIELAKALDTNTTLRRLSIGFNGVGEKGINALMSTLENTNDSLKHLGLGRWTIQMVHVKVIAQWLRAPKNESKSDSGGGLTYMDLGGCDMVDEHIKIIADALKRNKRLEVLELHSNRLSKAGFESIAESLRENTALEKISLAGNPGESEEEDLVRRIKIRLRNNRIWDVLQQQDGGDALVPWLISCLKLDNRYLLIRGKPGLFVGRQKRKAFDARILYEEGERGRPKMSL